MKAKEFKKRFDFMCNTYSYKDVALWWKFMNGDDSILEEIQERRRNAKPGEYR